MRSKLGRLLAVFLVFSLGAGLAQAQPATDRSKRIARYGVWSVVEKTGHYILQPGNKRGTYRLCSAYLSAPSASLEFEAKNKTAWAVYVAVKGWRYRVHRAPMTVKSGARQIRLHSVYGGSMISAASRDLFAGQRIPMSALKALIAQSKPLVFYDDRNRELVTFPNPGSDLHKALDRAIRCSGR